jgi:BsuBI/PstI restriction endonuclease domain/BsuBI/PstI restriction endonuclease HTH domain
MSTNVVPAWLEKRFPSLTQVQRWLPEIFPEGTSRRSWLTNPNAARTVFVMLYCLAVGESGRWIAPKAVVEMSDQQARRAGLRSRVGYLERILKPGQKADGQAWLATNSREGIRDEAIRALKEVGAVIERELPKTSGKGRYALTADFADLFDPARRDTDREAKVAAWREAHLSREELARVAILAAQVATTVVLPDGTTKPLSAGPSAGIVKGVIEQFAPRFLAKPVVLSYSDSAAPIAYINENLMRQLGLEYRAGDPLPDVLLADIARPLRLVSVEAVATEGPVDPARVAAVTAWLGRSGIGAGHVYFVTAYLHRGDAAFRKTVGEVAWRTALWFVAEPQCLLAALDGSEIRNLRDLPGW